MVCPSELLASLTLESVEASMLGMVAGIIKAIGALHVLLLVLWLIITAAKKAISDLKHLAFLCGARKLLGGQRSQNSRAKATSTKRSRKKSKLATSKKKGAARR